MSERVILQTARLTLRPLRATDFDAYAAYCGSERAQFVGGPYARPDAFNKFCAMIGHWQMRGFGRLAICLKGSEEAFGHAGLLQTDEARAPEITWTLWDGAFEGRGYASEAARAVRDHAFGALGLPLLTAILHKQNTASARVAEALGAVPDPALPVRYADERAFRLDAVTEVPA
ncbi:GNAT family N-acetyltransferase [Roseivivax sediminis]|uniref:Protein N-acetyltransferase, RimJ/RimL family n=1 Tax=Roseivivax sediminis TaxID=936889 RepID=A0A1I2AZZ3_9RHOB|nr:GNAT family N-acetyltransferase [Roseivivax sediminis]SFE49504.1 Protein N-acetyltransferase, RimJ/RimL family [Roseivivax sediminis]